MKNNVGSWDRWFRGLGAVAMLIGAVMAPLPLLVRLGAFGLTGGYLLFTALAGSCFGYTLMGKSTCPLQQR